MVLIGAGNIGSRHLQALKLTQKDLTLLVCEPNSEMVSVAKSRYDEYPDNDHIKRIEYLSDYRQIRGSIDVVIIATSARERFDIAVWIANNCNVRFMVLEKVLFQRIADYDEFEKIISNKGIKVWVNCPRRMFDLYKNIKIKIKNKDISMKVIGNDWGLACNCMHYLDLFAFLLGESHFDYDIHGLEYGFTESKRKGFVELYGRLRFASDNGTLEVVSTHDRDTSLVIIIESQDIRYEIYEDENKYYVVEGGARNELPFEMIYQSKLSHVFAEQLIDNGDCDLTPYKESSNLHKILLKGLLNHINGCTGTYSEVCPIT